MCVCVRCDDVGRFGGERWDMSLVRLRGGGGGGGAPQTTIKYLRTASYQFSCGGGVTLHLLHLFAPDAAHRTFLSLMYTTTVSLRSNPAADFFNFPLLLFSLLGILLFFFPASRGDKLIDRTSAAAKRLKKRRGGREGGRTQTNFRYISKRKCLLRFF